MYCNVFNYNMKSAHNFHGPFNEMMASLIKSAMKAVVTNVENVEAMRTPSDICPPYPYMRTGYSLLMMNELNHVRWEIGVQTFCIKNAQSQQVLNDDHLFSP